MSDLRETFIEELKDLYDAEKQITKALPKLVKAATHEELSTAFQDHLDETETQISRLEQVFEIFGTEPRGKKCKGMAGLLEEGKEIIEEEQGDAAIICAAQKVEHYEIAAYGSLVAWARLLEEDEAADLLSESLEEEKAADERLSEIAETAANPEEAAGEEEEEEEESASSRRKAKK